MKKALLFLALIATVGMYAQEKNPTFEQEGELVKATYFHENGEVAQTGYFLNEKLEGEWKMYNVKGKKIAMGEYAQGVKTGKWFYWNAANLSEVDYANNAITNVVQWNNAEAIVFNK